MIILVYIIGTNKLINRYLTNLIRFIYIIYIGKTTSVHALARELLGSYYKDAVLELNASDARGIDVRLLLLLLL